MQLKAAPDPSKLFFWGSRGRPGARKCVRGVVFLHSSGSLLTSFLDPKSLPKLALLNFFKFISSDFIASLKFSKNSRGQLGPQEGPGRPVQEAKNRSKHEQNPSFFETPSWTPKWLQNGPKNIEMLKTQWIFTSQAKFCLSAGPFFATPIEDSRSHCQKPIMFSPSYARSYTKNKVSVAKKHPKITPKITQKMITRIDQN